MERHLSLQGVQCCKTLIDLGLIAALELFLALLGSVADLSQFVGKVVSISQGSLLREPEARGTFLLTHGCID